MAARKKRPVLYEVIRPEHRRGEPEPGLVSRPQTAPPPREPGRTAASATPPPIQPVSPSTEEPVRTERTFNISASMLTVIAACVIMLVFVAFVAGRQFDAKSSGGSPEPFKFDLERVEESPVPRIASTAGTEAVKTDKPPGSSSSEQKAPIDNKDAESQRSPTVALQKGNTYIVVQHFSKNRRADAEAAALFLQNQRVPCALLVGNDIRLVATEAFLVDQRDKAAAERERRRLGTWLQQIKELGRQYDKMLREQGKPSYTFSECYPTVIR